MFEHINTIDALSYQIKALLDLICSSDNCVDHESIQMAADMCATMHDELMVEIDIISNYIREDSHELHKNTDRPIEVSE